MNGGGGRAVGVRGCAHVVVVPGQAVAGVSCRGFDCLSCLTQTHRDPQITTKSAQNCQTQVEHCNL